MPAPRVRAPQQRRQASGRTLLVAGVVVVLIAVGIGLGVALSGGSSGTSSGPLTNVSTVRTLLNGIPQQGNVLGSSTAPVTLVEYADMQCPYCDAFETQVFPGLVRDYIRPGKVRMVVRPLAFIGPDSVRGRNAVVAAGDQGRFFNLMEILYFNQGTENTGWLSESMVKRAATAAGLNVARFDAARNSAGVSAAARGFDGLAKAQAVHRTPTVLVGKTGGTLRNVQLSSPTDAASVVNAIQLVSS